MLHLKVKNKALNRLEGTISISSKGTGYVRVLDEKPTKNGDDIEIDGRHLNTALHGDIVQVLLHPRNKNRITGEVTKIIHRAKIGFAGVLETENPRQGGASKIYFLKPDDTKNVYRYFNSQRIFAGAKVGQKVFAEIVSWADAKKAPLGKVVKILGRPGDNDTEMHSIAMEKGFDSELPQKVEEEAKKIKLAGIKESDYAERRDFRKVLTFTIDPSDAKDFDDAISFKEVGADLYEIGIHIADVSHYVKVGSALDIEARERGTSVYLVDRTIPMLPEVLSNDLCSLVPIKTGSQ